MTDLFSLAGRTALLTGASSGIGHHLAGTLAAAGARVVMGARTVSKLEERVAELRAAGHEVAALPLDVRDRASVDAFFDEADALYGAPDVLVNNAGIETGAQTYVTLQDEDWDNVLDTNLRGAWWMAREFTTRVAARDAAAGAGASRGGVVLNVSSITSRMGTKGMLPYAVSKAAMDRMTSLMALEGAKYGIRVNAIAPGYIYTNVSKALLDSPASEDFRKRIPLRRYGEFEDLDGPVLLLCSDAGRYMTGSVLTVDGGHVCASL